MTRFACLGVVAACLPIGGCGTLAHNFCGPFQRDEETGQFGLYPRYYGGVWMDRQMIRDGHYALVLDLPFSFVADSVIAAALWDWRRKPAGPPVTATRGSAGPGPAGMSAGPRSPEATP